MRKLLVRRDKFAVLLGVGVVTSVTALLMHSVVDFNLHNGAVGLYFFFLCGLLVAVVNTRYSHYQTDSLLKKNSRYDSTLLAAGSCFLVVAVAVQVGILAAASGYSKVKDIYVSSHLAEEIVRKITGSLGRSMMLDPLESLYPFYRGNIAVIKESRELAFSYYLLAAKKRPMEGIFLQRLGMMLPVERREEAVGLMREGYKRALNKDKLIFSWAEWLVTVGKREQAIELLKERFVIDPKLLVRMVPLLEAHQFSKEEMDAVLPRSSGAWIRYGQYLEKMGNIEEALYYLKKALDFIGNENEIKPYWFNQLIYFYRRHKEPEKALVVIRQAIEKIPDHPPYHIWLGDYYKKEGINYRAREEYEKAVMLDPENESYRKRLRRIELDIEFGE